MITYTVHYRIVGTDHSGYCSGSESSAEDFVEFFKVEKRALKKPIANLKELNYFHRGCTSGGSGYCCGYGQTHIAMSILSVSEEVENDPDEKKTDKGEFCRLCHFPKSTLRCVNCGQV